MEVGLSAPRLQPFCAWRYRVSGAEELSLLVTPPYDVISPERRDALAAASRHNFVHLILPRGRNENDPYMMAAENFRTWRQDGTLIQDPRPGFTLHHQTYHLAGGVELTRRGLLGLIPLDPENCALVHPHEKTLSGPRQDRTALMEAVGAHLSPIFMLAPDPEGKMEALMEEAAALETEPAQEPFTDGDGVRHQIQVLTDPTLPRKLQSLLRQSPFLIADGHHRFESAVQLDQAMRLRRAHQPGPSPDTGRVLVELVSLASSGLTILPIHRVITGMAGFEPEAFLSRLKAHGHLMKLKGSSARELESRVLEGPPGTFGLAVTGSRELFLMRSTGVRSQTDPLAALDVTWLHEKILAADLGIDSEMVEKGTVLSFTRHVEQATEAVFCGRAQLAFILSPPTLGQLQAVTDEGLKMPQKSTFFHPKLPAGLVVHSFT